MKALIDYLRVAVACAGFVLIDPLISFLLSWLPGTLAWVTGLVSVAVSAGISWLIFRFAGPLTFIEFQWGDKASRVKSSGPVLDIDSATAASKGQIFALSMHRTTSTVVAKWALRKLMERNLHIEITFSQDELQMALWSQSPLVTSHRDRLTVGFGKADHDVHVVPFDLGLTWDELATPEFEAKIEYKPTCEGRFASWAARLLIVIKPTVKTVRNVGVNV